MLVLKQSTSVTRMIGPFLDATDGVTEETGLGSMGVELSKNGGAFAARNDATATAHGAEGWYTCVLDATDTNTLGVLTLKAHASATHLPVWHEFMVVPANVYDALVSGSDGLEVDTTLIEGSAATALINAQADTALADYNGPTHAELMSEIDDVQTDIAAVKADTEDIETDTQDIQSRLPAALVGGRIDASVGAMATDVLTAAAVTVAAAQKLADISWRRAYNSIRTSSFGEALTRYSPLGMVAAVVNAWSPNATQTQIDVEHEDGSAFYSRTPTTDKNARPISALD